MAQTLQENDPYGAITWAKAALATFERIGAVRDQAEAVKLLRQLGVISGSAPRLRKPITERETEIVSLIALGLTNREIAERLVISPKTVEHHVSQILDKLNLRSRTEAAAFAVSGKLDEIKKS
jgi:DNA-binding NarL/FixJ family response regulator